MATMNVRLQDGTIQKISYPDSWTNEQVNQAIYKHLPPQQSKSGEASVEPSSGLSGIAEDVGSSFESLPDAFINMMKSIPGGVKNIGKYAAKENPLETLGNLGAGGVEGASQLLSAPQMLARYLGNKFPNASSSEYSKKPTFYESLMNFEKEHGMQPKNEEEASVRNLGNLIFGGKGLTKINSMPGRVAAISSQQGGAGGDPLHAAILSLVGERLANKSANTINKAAAMNEPLNFGGDTPPGEGGGGGVGNIQPTANIQGMPSSPGYMNTISNIPKAATNLASLIPGAVRSIPEVVGEGVSSALESAADYGSKLPMADKILQPTVGALASYIKHLSVKPEEMAKRKLFGDITSKDLPQINERIEAAKRLGLSFLTPGEALLSPFQTAKEANIGRTTPGAKLLYQKGSERTGTEARAIDNLLDTVYDERNLSPEKQANYNSAMESSVTPEFIEKWNKNPIVAWAAKQIENTPTYKSELQHTPKDSFEYWNAIKRIIGDLEGEERKGMKGFSSNAATKVRNRMVDEMDAINPNYETARNISEREYTRKALENVFDKKDMTLNNFWSFLKSDKAFNKINRKLEPFPEAQQKLKDIRMLSNDLIPFDESIRTSYKLERSGMSKDRNKLDALKRDLDERFGGEHDVASVNLMTHPDWQNILIEYLRQHRK